MKSGPQETYLVEREDRELVLIGRDLARVLSPSDWARTDRAEREQFLKQAYAHIRANFGLPPGLLEIESEMPERLSGGFIEAEDRTVLNARLLDTSDPSNALRTVVHECRHAVQFARLAGRMPLARDGATAREELELWRAERRRYLGRGLRGYEYNPLEVDAEGAGRSVVDDGYWVQTRIRETNEHSREICR